MSLVWKIELTNTAKKCLSKTDKQTAKKITTYLKEISVLDNPREKGKALTGNFVSLWRYRVGNYRLICSINKEKITILVVKIGHRKNVYR